MKALSHFKTITAHKWLVMKYCFRMGLYKQGLLHDLSKYSYTEFRIGCKYYQGNRSPNAMERELFGYSTAWLHHKGRNKHHYEYWIDVDPVDKTKLSGVRMPARYLAEMVADRIAANRIYKKDEYDDGCPMEYYERTKDYMVIHPDTRAELVKILAMVRDQGEDAAIRYVKEEIVKKNRYGQI